MKSGSEAFWEHIEITWGCWLWSGPTISAGYGTFHDEGRQVYAHRAMYEEAFGPIPPGLEIDHLCRNPSCVRPDHLEAVTHRENMMRSPTSIVVENARKTHCKHGHPFAGDNLALGSRGQRVCLICERRRRAAWNERRRERRAKVKD